MISCALLIVRASQIEAYAKRPSPIQKRLNQIKDRLQTGNASMYIVIDTFQDEADFEAKLIDEVE